MSSYSKQITLTIDDLPFTSLYSPILSEEGDAITNMLLQHLQRTNTEAVGFVIGSLVHEKGEVARRTNMLIKWQNNGHILGNHTYSHLKLSSISLEEFEEDVLRNEQLLTQIWTKNTVRYRYFRFPYLDGRGIQRQKANAFLNNHSYMDIPVTMDFKDYVFDTLYTNAWLNSDAKVMQAIVEQYLSYARMVIEFREQQALQFIKRPLGQIILVHANRINADCLDKVIEVAKQQGYRFASLQEVLAEPLYQQNVTAMNMERFLSWESKMDNGKPMQITYPKVDPTILDAYNKCLAKKSSS